MKAMSPKIARVIGCVGFVLPALLSYLAGLLFGSNMRGLYVATVWIGVYMVWNIDIVDQQEWRCVERLGQFYDVKLRGVRLYCLRGLIDKVKAEGRLTERKKQIFVDFEGKPEELDFLNGSAPLEAYMWYKNGLPGGTDAQIKEDIVAYMYTNDDPEDRVVQIAEDRLRPKFQGKDVDTASRTRADVVNGVRADIAKELKPYGLYFSKEPPIVIADIGLTDAEKLLRQERLRGQTTADEIASESAGYRRGIEAIMYRDNPDGTQKEVCSFDKAADIWQEQQTKKMFEKTGSHITVMAGSASEVVKTFNVSSGGNGNV